MRSSHRCRNALLAVIALAALPAAAQETTLLVPTTPSVAVTGAATTKVQNDRMNAVLRIEAESASAAAAGNEVNARMGKALARAKDVAGIEVKSAGYSTWQTWDKGKPSKWKVVQSIALAGADFPALAALVTRLQDEDGLLVSSIGFGVAPQTRRKAEDGLLREAIKAWQQRATTASEALGYASWRPGRVSVNTADFTAPPRAEYAMRMQASAAAAPAPQMAVEGGTTDLTVTVSGDAVLETAKAR